MVWGIIIKELGCDKDKDLRIKKAQRER